jgi:hypothetical protein
MQDARAFDLDVGAQAAALLAAANAYVVVARRAQGQARQHDVAVHAALMLSSLADTVIHPQLFGDESRLIRFAWAAFVAHDLLERDDVRVDLAQHFDYARGPHAAVESLALVNVVRGYPQPLCLIPVLHYCVYPLKALFVSPPGYRRPLIW